MVDVANFVGLTGSRALPKWEAFPFIAETGESIDFIHLNGATAATASLFGLTAASVSTLAGLTADFTYVGVTAVFSSGSVAGSYACTVSSRPAATQIAQVTYDGAAVPGAVVIFIGADVYSTPTLDMTSVRNANIFRSSSHLSSSGYIPLAVLLRFDRTVQPLTTSYTAHYWVEEGKEGQEEHYAVSEASVSGLNIVLDIDINARSSAYRAGYGMQLYAQIPDWGQLTGEDFQYVVVGPSGGSGGGAAVTLAPVFSVTNDVVLNSAVTDGVGHVLALDAGVYTTVFYPDFDVGAGGTGDRNVLVAQFQVAGGKNATSTYTVDVYELDGTVLGSAGKQALNVAVTTVDGDGDGDDESTVSLYFDLDAGATGSARDTSFSTSGTVTVTDDLSRTLNLEFTVIALANPELTLTYNDTEDATGVFYAHDGVHAHRTAYGATGIHFKVGDLTGNWLNTGIGSSYAGVTLGALQLSSTVYGALVGVTGTIDAPYLVFDADRDGLIFSELYEDVNVDLTEHGRTFPRAIKYVKAASQEAEAEPEPVGAHDVHFYVFPQTVVDGAVDILDANGEAPYNDTVVYGAGLSGGYQVGYYPDADKDVSGNTSGVAGTYGVLTFSLKGGQLPSGSTYSVRVLDFGVAGGSSPGATGLAGVTGSTVAVTTSGLAGTRYSPANPITEAGGATFTVEVTDAFGATTLLKVQVLALANPTAEFVYSDDVFSTRLTAEPFTRGRPLPADAAGADLDFNNGGALTTVAPITHDASLGYVLNDAPFELAGSTSMGSSYAFNGVTGSLTGFVLAFINSDSVVPGYTRVDGINAGATENGRSFATLLADDAIRFYMYPRLEVTSVWDIVEQQLALHAECEGEGAGAGATAAAYPVVYYPTKDVGLANDDDEYPVARFTVTGGLLTSHTYPSISKIVTLATSTSGVTGANVAAAYGASQQEDGSYIATLYYGATAATRLATTDAEAAFSSVTLTVTCDFESAVDAASESDDEEEAAAEADAATAATVKSLTFNVLALADPTATFAYSTDSFKRTYNDVHARPATAGEAVPSFTIGAITFNTVLAADACMGTTDSDLSITQTETSLALEFLGITGDSDSRALEFPGVTTSPNYQKLDGINVSVDENSRTFDSVITADDVQFYVYPALQVSTTAPEKVSASCLPQNYVAMHTSYGLGEYVLRGLATNTESTPAWYMDAVHEPFGVHQDFDTKARAVAGATADNGDVYVYPSVISFVVAGPTGVNVNDEPSYCHHMSFELHCETDEMTTPSLGSATVANFSVRATVKSIDGTGDGTVSESGTEEGPRVEEVFADDEVLVYADLQPLRETFERYQLLVREQSTADAERYQNASKLYADVALVDDTTVFPYNSLVSGGFLATHCDSSPNFCVHEEGPTGAAVAPVSFVSGFTGDATIITANLGSAARDTGVTGSQLRIVFHDGASNDECVEYGLTWCAHPSFTVNKPFVYLSDAGVTGTTDDDNFVNGRAGAGGSGTAYDFSITTSDTHTVKEAALFQMELRGLSGGTRVADFGGAAGPTGWNSHIEVTSSTLTYTRLEGDTAADPTYDYRIEVTVSEAFEPDNLVLLQLQPPAMLELTTAAANEFTASQLFTFVDRSYGTDGITGQAARVHMTNFNENNEVELEIGEGVTCHAVDPSAPLHLLVDNTPEDTTGLVAGFPSYNVVAYHAGGLFNLDAALLTGRDTYVLAIAAGATGSVTWDDVKDHKYTPNKAAAGGFGVEFYTGPGPGTSLGSVLFVQKHCGRLVVTNSGLSLSLSDAPALASVVAIATTRAPAVSWESWDADAEAAKYALTVLQVTEDALDSLENPIRSDFTDTAPTSTDTDGQPDGEDSIVVRVDTYSIWLTRAAAIRSFVFGHYASGLTGSALQQHEIPDATRLGIRDGSLELEDGCDLMEGQEDGVKVVYSLRARLEDPGLAASYQGLQLGNREVTYFDTFADTLSEHPWLELATNVTYNSSTDITSYAPVTIGDLKQLLYGPTGGQGLRIGGDDEHALAEGNDVRAWPERLWPSGSSAPSWDHPGGGYTLRYRLYVQTPARLRSDYFTVSTSYSEAGGASGSPGFDYGTTGPTGSPAAFDYFSIYFKAYSEKPADGGQGALWGSIRNSSTVRQFYDLGMKGSYVQRYSIRDNQATDTGKYFANYDVAVSKAFTDEDGGRTGAGFDGNVYYLTTFDTLARGKATDTEVVVVKGVSLVFTVGQSAAITFPTPLARVPTSILLQAEGPFTDGSTPPATYDVVLYVNEDSVTATGFTVTHGSTTATGTLTGSVKYIITTQSVS